MKNALTGAVVLCMLATACKKEETPLPNPPPIVATPQSSLYFPLDSGSYWVYAHYRIDSLGNETYTQSDSIWVEGDSTVNGNTYRIVRNTGWFPQLELYRDSANCMVTSAGTIVFAAGIAGQPISYRRDSSSVSGPILETTDSMLVGTYTFSNYSTLRRSTFVTLFVPFAGGSPRRFLTDFASGVGMVRNQYSYSSQVDYFERRLVRYRIGQ